MSIHQRIAELVGKGDLLRYEPAEAVPEMRDIYVSRIVAAFLGGVPRKYQETAGNAQLLFDEFVGGEEISFGMSPKKHPGALIARNAPVDWGICDFRVLHPEPSVRIFGGFAARDTFVALTYQPRSTLTNVFQNAAGIALSQWKLKFPDHKPIVSEKAEDYVGQPFFAC